MFPEYFIEQLVKSDFEEWEVFAIIRDNIWTRTMRLSKKAQNEKVKNWPKANGRDFFTEPHRQRRGELPLGWTQQELDNEDTLQMIEDSDDAYEQSIAND